MWNWQFSFFKRLPQVFVAWAHFFVVMLVVLSTWSGVNIALDQRSYVKSFMYWWPGMSSPALWHEMAGSLLIVVVALYLLYRYYIRKDRKKNKQTVKPNVWGRRVLYVTLSVLILTGLLQMLGLLSSLQTYVRGTHLIFTALFVLTIFVHIYLEWSVGAWKQIKRLFFLVHVENIKLSAGLFYAFSFCFVVALFSLHVWQANEVIFAPKVQTGIRIDGVDNDPQWRIGTSKTISTYFGFPYSKVVPVEVKMLNDGYGLYIYAKWPDASKSEQHLPLIKTAQGWVIQQNDVMTNDEVKFYEDKFAVMLGSQRWDALKSVFLDAKMGRGGHVMPKGEFVDVWHWKSVRNHEMNKLDDAFFADKLPSMPSQQRYSWGYTSDPLEAGGSQSNWKYLKTGVMEPIRLPREPDGLKTFQDTGVKREDEQGFGLYWNRTQPYDRKIDDYPIGTIMPSVLWTYSNNGDRGNVRAAGKWHDGFWHLELYRNFASESEYDKLIEDGSYFWFSTFNHSQTRHTYHLRPLRLELGK